MNRSPIIDNPIRSWSIAVNPFGDEIEHAGFMVACYDPVTGETDGRSHASGHLVGDLYPTRQQAEDFLAILLDT